MIKLSKAGVAAPTRGELRKLRKKITDALLGAGFVFDPENKDHRVTMYEGRYTKYQLPYKALAEGKGILRPDVQIETSVWPLRRGTVNKPMTSFIATNSRLGRAFLYNDRRRLIISEAKVPASMILSVPLRTRVRSGGSR